MYKLTDLYLQLKEEEQASQIQQYKIYCDADGVLTDFNGRFEYFYGISPKEYEEKNGKGKFWEAIDDKIGVDFWSKMSWMPEGKKLWGYIKKYNPYILSAPSRNYVSRHGKKIWVQNNIPGTKLILASRENKKNYAHKNHILIDDMKKNIDEWVFAGGVGIQFISTEQVIGDLKKLGL